MSLFSVDIQKRQGPEYWTNRYFVSGTSVDEASTRALDLYVMEVAFHTENITFDKVLIRPYPNVSNSYKEYLEPYNGGYDGGALSGQIPLFNVVRVDFPAPTGRPSRKYYRVGLTEAMVDGSNLTTSYATVVQNAINAWLASNIHFLRNDRDQALDSAAVFPAVAMHQLRRGSKRKVTPVI